MDGEGKMIHEKTLMILMKYVLDCHTDTGWMDG